ncbi:hypothetical protein ZIOFF_002253 [Zingiber officinale]|uniref:Uncharacterized protein n=1 Tax=Zingiber officinale TaxID=94328 RepID=A0A8J5M9B8_ZINOF|nr:hypothetical protein ZIOFF_002253 [Zingiber officinale]
MTAPLVFLVFAVLLHLRHSLPFKLYYCTWFCSSYDNTILGNCTWLCSSHAKTIFNNLRISSVEENHSAFNTLLLSVLWYLSSAFFAFMILLLQMVLFFHVDDQNIFLALPQHHHALVTDHLQHFFDIPCLCGLSSGTT